AGHPADVGRAPEHVPLGVQVEHVAGRPRALHQVARGGVHDPLGLGGGARGVQQVEEVLAVDGDGLALGRRGGDEVVPPVVTAVLHLDVGAAAVHDDHAAHAGAALDGDVHVRLQRRGLAAPVAGVGGDDHDGGRVVDAV